MIPAVYTTPNHHPPKWDVLPKTFLQIILANKWLVRHSSTVQYALQPAAKKRRTNETFEVQSIPKCFDWKVSAIYFPFLFLFTQLAVFFSSPKIACIGVSRKLMLTTLSLPKFLFWCNIILTLL